MADRLGGTCGVYTPQKDNDFFNFPGIPRQVVAKSEIPDKIRLVQWMFRLHRQHVPAVRKRKMALFWSVQL
jgi:hypothetical protein